jgi:serine phosphatase RsbU (regulator of sigma subunit)/anti-sigma regulatory factor (Ser/Thr protein kinase)
MQPAEDRAGLRPGSTWAATPEAAMQNPFPSGDEKLALDKGIPPLTPARREPTSGPSLQAMLTRALAAFGLMPLLLLAAIGGLGDYFLRLEQAQTALRSAVSAASVELDLFLSAHLGAVRQVAFEIESESADERALVRRLERTRTAFPALVTMLVSDAEGRIRAGSFDNRIGVGREHWFGSSVADRSYFQIPRDTGGPAVSPAFRGRGFGEDVLCAVAAPTVDADGRFAGVVQGSIRVTELGLAFRTSEAAAQALSVVILDPENKIAWSSPELGLEPLRPPPPGLLVGAGPEPRFRRVDINALPAGDSLVAEGGSGHGWRVVGLLPRRVLLEQALMDAAAVLPLLALIVLLALLAGRRFAVRLLRPIEEIGARMDSLALAHHPESYRSDTRIAELARLEASFVRLGERLAESRRQLHSEWEKESTLRGDLAAARAESERAEGELDAARDIQMSLLPSRTDLARIDDRLDVAALLEPMSAVGGDFFNVIALDTDKLLFFIGDVSDKGVPAALFMARTVTLLEAAAAPGETPAAILRRVGRVLARDNVGGMFVTVLVGCIDLDSGAVLLASAGHDPPLLRRFDGHIEVLGLNTGPALGFEEAADYPQIELHLQPGELLLGYTDGLTEAENAEGLPFGEEGVARQLAGSPRGDAAEVVDGLADAVDAYRAGSPADDLTLLCLRRPPWTAAAAGGRMQLPAAGARDPLEALLDALQERLQAAGVETGPCHDARLVLEEVLSNARDYGAEEPLAASVDYRVRADRLDLLIEDNARAFDPLAQNLPDIDRPLAQRGIGGLGLLLVRELTREPRYERIEGRNRLSLWLPRPSFTKTEPPCPYP